MTTTKTYILIYENEEAGLILLNNGSHFDLKVQTKNGQRIL
jgi:hypothetical protein